MKKEATGVYQLENGNWGYRYGMVLNGKTVWRKKIRDSKGNVIKTKSAAIKERNKSMMALAKNGQIPKKKQVRKTVSDVYNEYCVSGRHGKAYSTIRKQDSLWRNHIADRFGDRYLDELTVAEINDYLATLYYVENRAYRYVESFLKMFYLIVGQAYMRGYIESEHYNKFCKDKTSKIHMPKMKINEEMDIVVFNKAEIAALDDYFSGSNAETAYMIGKYCGLRINECYGLKWNNIDFKAGTITVDRQMQYQEGLIKLVPLKTRNAKRTVFMCDRLKAYLSSIKTREDSISHTQALQREQNQTYIYDFDGSKISSLEMVNCLPNGKIQTVNSMKFHSQTIKEKLGIDFKYHYLRHTYGTNLANLNTPSHILCSQMGHGNINVTMKYYLAVSDSGIDILKKNLDKRIL